MAEILSNPNETNTTVGSPLYVSKEYLLWLANEDLYDINLPCVVFYVISVLFGIFGNALVIFVFGFRFKKSTANLFVMYLSVFDTITCFMLIFEVFDKRLPMYSGLVPGLCKLVRCIEVFANGGASIILVSIAFDRYYKICKPFKRFKMRTARNIIVGAFVFMLFACWPMAIFHGTETVKTVHPGVIGKDCADDDKYIGSVFPSIYFIAIFICIMVCIVLIIVLYTIVFIAIVKWKHRVIGEKFRLNSMSESYNSSPSLTPKRPLSIIDPNNVEQNIGLGNTGNQVAVIDDETLNRYAAVNEGFSDIQRASSCLTIEEMRGDMPKTVISNRVTIEHSGSPTKEEASSDYVINSCVQIEKSKLKLKYKVKLDDLRLKFRRRSSKTGIRLSATTVVFSFIALMYVLSYIPTIVVEVINAIGHLKVDFLPRAARRAIVIANSAYFLNGAFNPLIYGMFNKAFREELMFIIKGY